MKKPIKTTPKNKILSSINSVTDYLLQLLMKIKDALPDETHKYKIIKHFNSKKCLSIDLIKNFTDDRVSLGYMEQKLLDLIRYRIKYYTLKEKYGQDSEFDGLLNSLVEKKYLYKDGIDIYRISEESYLFMQQKEKIYLSNSLKIIKEWDLGFAFIQILLAHPFDGDAGSFLFNIEFKNQMNFDTFVKFNNYNYRKYIPNYDLFLLGYFPSSDIEFKKNIKIMVYSLYLSKLYDDMNMRYDIVPQEILFKEFYRWLNSEMPHIESLPPFWHNDDMLTEITIGIE